MDLIVSVPVLVFTHNSDITFRMLQWKFKGNRYIDRTDNSVRMILTPLKKESTLQIFIPYRLDVFSEGDAL